MSTQRADPGEKRLTVVSEATSGGVWAAACVDAEAARADGWAVTLVAPSHGPAPEAPPGVTVVRLTFPRAILDYRRSIRARRELAFVNKSADVVHVHGIRGAALLWPRRHLIVTYHGAAPLGRNLLRRALLKALLLAVPRLTSHAFSVVPLRGWELAWYPVGDAVAPQMRRSFEQLISLLWFGRVSPQKKFEDFITLAVKLRSLNLLNRAVVAGRFDENMEHLRLEAEANEIEVLGHVTDVEALLARDWVVCLFSHFEGRPFAVEEAMSRGLPVIVSDLPGNRLMITDDRFLVSSSDQALLAATILQEPASRQAIGRKMQDDIAAARPAHDYKQRLLSAYRKGHR